MAADAEAHALLCPVSITFDGIGPEGQKGCYWLPRAREAFRAQKSMGVCPRSRTCRDPLAVPPVLSILVILHTVPCFKRGFQDERLEEAKPFGRIVYEDLEASKGVWGPRKGRNSGRPTPEPGGLGARATLAPRWEAGESVALTWSVSSTLPLLSPGGCSESSPAGREPPLLLLGARPCLQTSPLLSAVCDAEYRWSRMGAPRSDSPSVNP